MGLWARTGRFWRGALLLAVGLAGGAAAVAVATVPDSNGVIHGCYSVDGSGMPVTTGPNLTVIDPSAGQSCVTNSAGRLGQRSIDWNVQGPPGQQGPQGPPGNTATVVGGGTLTLPGGQVLTVEGVGGGITIPNPARGLPRGSNLVLGSGASARSFPILDVSFLSSHVGGGSAGSGATSRVAIKDISIMKKVDKSSPILFKACASGQHFPKATITLRKKGGQPYLRYILSDVLVSAIQSAGKNGEPVPTEQVTFSYGKVQVQYLAQR